MNYERKESVSETIHRNSLQKSVLSEAKAVQEREEERGRREKTNATKDLRRSTPFFVLFHSFHAIAYSTKRTRRKHRCTA
jgi:hypothetical protein